MRVGAVAALFLLVAGSAAADSFLVVVNTTAVSGVPGFIELQFNPGDPSSQTATAQITNFNEGGNLLFNASPATQGDVAGTLPATVTLVNDTPFNDYFQQVTFGGFFSFVLSLTGQALDSPNGTAVGSTFSVGLDDSSGSPILTNDPSGFAGQVLVNQDGSTTPQSFPSTATNGPPVVTFQVIPEPGTMALLGFGSLSLMLLGRRRG